MSIEVLVRDLGHKIVEIFVSLHGVGLHLELGTQLVQRKTLTGDVGIDTRSVVVVLCHDISLDVAVETFFVLFLAFDDLAKNFDLASFDLSNAAVLLFHLFDSD